MNPSRRPKSSTLIIGYLLLFSLLATSTIAIIETATYAAISNPSAIPQPLLEIFRRYYRQFDIKVPQLDPECGRYDEELSYTLLPGTCEHQNREFNVTINANSLGLRDNEASLESPEIILLGDSYAMGWGVENTESFAQLIEQKTRMKLLNAGIPSYGTYRQMGILKRLDHQNIKHLLIQYCENDYFENKSMGKERLLTDAIAYAQVSTDHKSRQKYIFGEFTVGLSQILFNAINQKVTTKKTQPIPALSPEDQDVLEAQSFVAVLRKFQHLLAGKRITVFETNGHAFADDKFINALNQELANRPDINLDITTLSLSTGLSKTEHFFRLDEHILASGHRYVAEVVANHLGYSQTSKEAH